MESDIVHSGGWARRKGEKVNVSCKGRPASAAGKLALIGDGVTMQDYELYLPSTGHRHFQGLVV